MAMYTVRTHKRWLGAGGRPWTNSYEVITGGSSISTPGVSPDDIGPLEAFAVALINFERTLSWASVYFEKVTISTWIPDSTPYNADELMSRPSGVYGLRALNTSNPVADLRLCLGVSRVSYLGNPGKLPLRGVLGEAEYEAGAQGVSVLSPTAVVGPGGSLWLSARDELVDYLDSGALTGQVVIVMIHSPSPETYSARVVGALSPLGVTKVNLTKKYYNRA